MTIFVFLSMHCGTQESLLRERLETCYAVHDLFP